MTRYTKFKKTFNSTSVSTTVSGNVQKPKGGFERGAGYAASSSVNNKSLNCLKCRQPGHKMRDCPENKVAPEYCYNCGEVDHSTKQCPMPFTNYAHALCFICNTKGHLASACPKNDRGVYPNGGCCHYCGSIKHLGRNCRPTQSASNGNEVIISASLTSGTNPEIDDVHEALQKIQHNRTHRHSDSAADTQDSNNNNSETKLESTQQKKKTKKVVNF